MLEVETAGRRSVEKCLIFNADDFGASTGVNRGILECHTRGVVTSTSLIVTGRAVQEAISMSRVTIRRWPLGYTGTCGARTNGSSISMIFGLFATSFTD